MIHEARDTADGLIINPAAFTHTSVAIFDALNTFEPPVIEVHISNVHKREAFRHHSFVSLRADGVIAGLGTQGYSAKLSCAPMVAHYMTCTCSRSRKLTAGQVGGAGVDAAFDAIGGSHFDRSFACLAPGGILIGYGSQTMAVGRENIIAAGLGLARLKLWGALSFLFRGRRALGTASRTAACRTLKNIRLTWLHCSSCSATVPFILWLSLANH